MADLLAALKRKRILVSDGAWGTLLQAKGLAAGECPESWNLSHPDQVRAVAADYARAGADMVLSNTFGGSRPALKRYGWEERVAEVNEAGARLSLEGAGEATVAASVGPTGELLAPLGLMSGEELEGIFAEQMRALLKAGVRVLCIETMSAVEEAACAVRAARQVDPGFQVIATMTFNETPKGFRTMMGVDPARAVEELSKAGADVLGANCGQGIRPMIGLAAELRRLTDRPILIHANAGLPELIEGRTVFKETPAQMAACVPDLVRAGADIIGGCCGTTPDHISAIREEVDRLRRTG